MMKKENNKAGIICADLLQEDPQYLCMDEYGSLYTCRVGQMDGRFFEKDIEKVDISKARLFLSDVFINASRTINANSGNGDISRYINNARKE